MTTEYYVAVVILAVAAAAGLFVAIRGGLMPRKEK